MPKAPGYPLDSVGHALKFLVLLRTRGGLRVTEAATALGVAKSTAHRLLSMLCYQDFAVQDAQRIYRPGPEMAQMRPASRLAALRTSAEPHLRSLSRLTGETTHLMFLEGNGARFLIGVEGRRSLSVGMRTGMLLPAHTTSGGKVLLAELPSAALRALYPRGLPKSPMPAISDLPQLRQELGVVRRRGFATNIDESGRGVSAVSRSLHDETGRAIAAVAIAMPSNRCWSSLVDELADVLSEVVTSIEGGM